MSASLCFLFDGAVNGRRGLCVMVYNIVIYSLWVTCALHFCFILPLAVSKISFFSRFVPKIVSNILSNKRIWKGTDYAWLIIAVFGAQSFYYNRDLQNTQNELSTVSNEIFSTLSSNLGITESWCEIITLKEGNANCDAWRAKNKLLENLALRQYIFDEELEAAIWQLRNPDELLNNFRLGRTPSDILRAPSWNEQDVFDQFFMEYSAVTDEFAEQLVRISNRLSSLAGRRAELREKINQLRSHWIMRIGADWAFLLAAVIGLRVTKTTAEVILR